MWSWADGDQDEGCRWLKPVLVGQFEFLEWTGDNHLRHSKFIALREDKSARDVKRE
jgi:bifunctional non-homologous end joining protein LigD